MYPVMCWRNTNGVPVWLHSWMNWAAFWDESEKSTPLLARIPTGKPCTCAHPVTSVGPYRILNSSKRLPSTTRAMISRASTAARRSSGISPSSSSGSWRGGSAAADEDVVVGQSRRVGPSFGGGAEHHRDRGDAPRGQLGDVVEHPAALGEVGEVAPHRRVRVLAGAAAAAQVTTGRLDELEVGHPVVPGDLQGAHQLADADHGHGPAEVGRVVADDHALGALDHANAQHHAAADIVVGLVAGQRAELKERAVRVEQQRDAFPDEQLAAAPVALDRPFPAANR